MYNRYQYLFQSPVYQTQTHRIFAQNLKFYNTRIFIVDHPSANVLVNKRDFLNPCLRYFIILRSIPTWLSSVFCEHPCSTGSCFFNSQTAHDASFYRKEVVSVHFPFKFWELILFFRIAYAQKMWDAVLNSPLFIYYHSILTHQI